MANKPDWDIIRQEYVDSDGTVQLKDLADKHGVKPGTLRSRKNREDWDAELSGSGGSGRAAEPGVATSEKKPRKKKATQRRNVATKKRPKTKPKPKISEEVLDQLEDADLTDKQRLFCMYYVKYWNATKAYQKAYECDYFTAKTNGSRLLANANTKTEIDRLKANIREGIGLDMMAIIQKYIDIAFADITDFVEFGQEETPVIGMYGPVKIKDPETEEETILTKTVNTVLFKDSSEVDGQIISEVKQGRDGASIKLVDRMKAMERLEKYYDLLPDKWKRRMDEERLKMEGEKLRLDKLKLSGNQEASENAIEAFLKATTMAEDDVKALFSGDDPEYEAETEEDEEDGDIDG